MSQDFRIPSRDSGLLLPIATEPASVLNVLFHKSIKNVAIPMSYSGQPLAPPFASCSRAGTWEREKVEMKLLQV